MSKKEKALKQFADGLSTRERAFMRAYLWMLQRTSDPAWRKEMTARRRLAAAGHHITAAEYEVISTEAARRAS
jgi:hypothetical protein